MPAIFGMRRLAASLMGAVLGGALLLGCAQAQVADPAGDAVIADMKRAWGQRDRATLTQLLPLVRGHVLEPWAAYWELAVRLKDAQPHEVQQFLQRHAGTYQEDRLRNDWMLLLGENSDWEAFRRHEPHFRMRDDPEIRCYQVLAEQAAGHAPTAATADRVRRDWQAQRRLGAGCTRAAGALLATGGLQAGDVWIKARLARDLRQHDQLRAAVGLLLQAPDHLAAMERDPLLYLALQADSGTPAGRQLAVLALIALARTDAPAAAGIMDGPWAGRLEPADADWVWGIIGKWATVDRNGPALDYFARVRAPARLPDDVLAWRVRAALVAGHWPTVVATVDAMRDPMADDGAWMYWKGRALQAQARDALDRGIARAAFQRVLVGASPRGYYRKLALQALGRPLVLAPALAALTETERAAARNHAGLQRALAAMALGLRSEGVREWNYWIALHEPGGMDDRRLLAAADLACRHQIWDRCINTSERTRGLVSMAQRYPMPMQEQLVRQARAIGLDPAFVYGLIRQESRFVTVARSGAGASGLMQIIPATARWTARHIGLDGFVPSMVYDPDINILLGTSYLKLLLDDFQGSMPLAASGYNAGPRRPRSWRQGPDLEGAIWVEYIPFSETRDYVKKVLANTVDYALLLGGPGRSLVADLGRVGPLPPGMDDPSIGLP